MERKSRFKTLENAKKFLVAYLAYCDINRYKVLQYFMLKDIFVSKRVRQSVLEEILEGVN